MGWSFYGTPKYRGPERKSPGWRGLVNAVAPASVAMGAAACGSTSSTPSSTPSSSSPASPKPITVAFVPGTTTNPFYVTMQAGAQAEANKLGSKLLWQGGTEWSASSQTAYVDALLADHPSALVIAPTAATAMQAPIQKFVSAHIPVITADTTITDTSLLNSRITCNNVSGGRQAADELASLIGDTGDQREDGFAREMAASTRTCRSWPPSTTMRA